MSRLNKDMDYAGMNALSKAKMIAIDKGQSELSPEMVAYAIILTGPNVVTETLAHLGVDIELLLAKLSETIIINKSKSQKNTQIIPSNNENIYVMGKRAKEIRDGLRHTRLGVHHLILAIIQVSPLVRDSVLGFGVNPQDLFNSLSKATKAPSISDSLDLPKKSQKESGVLHPELTRGLKKGVNPKKSGDVLAKYAIDLTAKAQAGTLSPVIGRDLEISRAFTVLCRKIKNNVLLIGEHGVGKTAIAEGIAQRIADGKAPNKLLNKRVFMIDMPLLIAGTQYRGQFEERIKSVMEAFEESNGEYIAFVDEIHTLLGAGSAVGTMDAANILKPALARGAFRCIGATTEDEYKKFFKKDGALDRRFQSVTIDEPSKIETVSILKGLRPSLEVFHNCSIADEALTSAVDMASVYMTSRHFPDKAIDIIDEMCSKYAEKKCVLLKQHVAETVSVLTKIPLEVLMFSEYEKILKIDKSLASSVFGQEEALATVSKALKRAYSGLRDPKRPLASILFSGPTGVGKTYLAEKLAEEIFGSQDSLIKLDMTGFSEKHTVTRLTGSPPSYVGYGERNQFIDRILLNPHSLVLLDEIEKAHEDVIKIFMDILLNGVITDAEGRKVSFRNSILIMTSNMGFSEGFASSLLGFGESGSKEDGERNKDRIVSLCSKQFGSEFSNRIDEVVLFKPLSNDDLKSVAGYSLKILSERVEEQGYSLKFSKSLLDIIVENSKTEHGQNASRIKRYIRNKMEPFISEVIMQGGRTGGILEISADKNKEIKVLKIEEKNAKK
jgi:ATP-dependent Clp protease ATP-binding subunit ClpC